LRAPGIAPGGDIAGDYSTLAQVRDPDGNLLTLDPTLAAVSAGLMA